MDGLYFNRLSLSQLYIPVLLPVFVASGAWPETGSSRGHRWWSPGWGWGQPGSLTPARTGMESAKPGHSQHNLHILTNQRPAFRSHDQTWPIRGQYSGHMIRPDQLEALFKSSNQSCPDQSEASIVVIFSLRLIIRLITATHALLNTCCIIF